MFSSIGAEVRRRTGEPVEVGFGLDMESSKKHSVDMVRNTGEVTAAPIISEWPWLVRDPTMGKKATNGGDARPAKSYVIDGQDELG